jgi:4-hydroxybenzoate polyprenyltransferase
MNERMMKDENIFKIYRVGGWYYYLGFIFLGLIFKNYFPSIIETIKYLLLGSFLLSYAYSLNDHCDKAQKKKFFSLPLILSFLLLFFFNFYQIITSLFFLIIVTLYSIKPFRLKKIPALSSLLNGFGFTSLFLIGYFHDDTILLPGILFATLLFSLEMVAQFIHEVVDLEKDKKEGIKTTTVYLGKSKIKILSILFLLTTIFITLWIWQILENINFLFFISTLLFSLFFIFQILTRKMDLKLRRRYKNFGIILGIFWAIVFLNSSQSYQITEKNLSETLFNESNYKCQNCNVILITFDALGADYLPFYGFDKETAPNLENFSKESYIFSNAISQSASTPISLCSLFTSRYPFTDNLIGEIRGLPYPWGCKENKIFLPYLFQDKGYSTYAIVRILPASSKFGFNQGFSYFNEKYEYTLTSARETFNIAILLTKNKIKKPFFLWVHNREPHSPYLPPEKYFSIFSNNKSQLALYNLLLKEMSNCFNLTYSNSTPISLHDVNSTRQQMECILKKFSEYRLSFRSNNTQEYVIYGKKLNISDEELKQLRARYFGNIRYADEHFGKFLRYIKKQPFYNNTIIIISADHGESLGEHNIFGHGFLYQDIIHVPLLIHLPGQNFTRTIDKPVELVGIYPTLLNILNLSVDYEIRGENLFNKKRNKTFQFSEYSNRKIIINDKIKFWDKDNELFFYNLSLDANELKKSNLLLEEKGSIFNISSLSNNIFLPQNESKISEIDEFVKQRLRGLGYET